MGPLVAALIAFGYMGVVFLVFGRIGRESRGAH